MSPSARSTSRGAVRVAAGLGLSIALAGCVWLRNRPEPPHTPAMVQRFADEANALGMPPSPPKLSDVTHTLARAVSALPRGGTTIDFGQQIDSEAMTLEQLGDGATALEPARRSLSAALQALSSLRHPAGAEKDRRRALDEAYRAVDALPAPSATGDSRATIENAYRAVARAMLILT